MAINLSGRKLNVWGACGTRWRACTTCETGWRQVGVCVVCAWARSNFCKDGTSARKRACQKLVICTSTTQTKSKAGAVALGRGTNNSCMCVCTDLCVHTCLHVRMCHTNTHTRMYTLHLLVPYVVMLCVGKYKGHGQYPRSASMAQH